MASTGVVDLNGHQSQVTFLPLHSKIAHVFKKMTTTTKRTGLVCPHAQIYSDGGELKVLNNSPIKMNPSVRAGGFVASQPCIGLIMSSDSGGGSSFNETFCF